MLPTPTLGNVHIPPFILNHTAMRNLRETRKCHPAMCQGARGNKFGEPHLALNLDPTTNSLWDLDSLNVSEPVSSLEVRMVVISWSALWPGSLNPF